MVEFPVTGLPLGGAPDLQCPSMRGRAHSRNWAAALAWGFSSGDSSTWLNARQMFLQPVAKTSSSCGRNKILATPNKDRMHDPHLLGILASSLASIALYHFLA